MNQLMGKIRNKQDVPLYMNIDGVKNYNYKQISEEFCKYFTNVGPNLADKIKSPNIGYDEYL